MSVVHLCHPAPQLMTSMPPLFDKSESGKFQPHEDAVLFSLVTEHPDWRWPKIAKKLGTKNARQCRDRYMNYLDPRLNHEEWTEEEDLMLVALYDCYGQHWVKISNGLGRRSVNSVRNRWQLLSRRSEQEKKVTIEKNEHMKKVEKKENGGEVEGEVDHGEEGEVVEKYLEDVTPHREVGGIFDELFQGMSFDDVAI